MVDVVEVAQRPSELRSPHRSPEIGHEALVAGWAPMQLPARGRAGRASSRAAAVGAGDGEGHAAVRGRPSCTPFIRCSAMAK
jgi:hypothetical protein